VKVEVLGPAVVQVSSRELYTEQGDCGKCGVHGGCNVRRRLVSVVRGLDISDVIGSVDVCMCT